MRTITEKYRAVLENNFSKTQFLRDAQRELPNLISKYSDFATTIQILKNKGILAEEKKAEKKNNPANFSAESIERGLDIELEAMGLDSVEAPSAEDLEKAKKKVIKNLEKDVNFYLNAIAGESAKVDKHDKEVEVKRGEEATDVFNGMKKATLKEGFGSTSLKEETMDLMAYLRKEKGADNEMIKDFIRTHFEDIKGMSLEEIGDEFDEFFYVNYETGSDYAMESNLKEAIKNIIKKTLSEENVEEVGRESYERIDGLTNLKLLEQLLNTAEAIYKDQIEAGDLFDSQDVAEYLATQIHKRLSKIDPEAETFGE